MKKKKRKEFPTKYVLLIMTILCVAIIVGNVAMSYTYNGASTVIGYVIIPMQKGINTIGNAISGVGEAFTSKQDLLEENESLRNQLAETEEKLNQNQLDTDELENLKSMYDVDKSFEDYDKVAANVIGKDSGNWFSTFLIDKGTDAGVEIGMNVISNGGLAGVVTEVGPTYAKVLSIIDDTSNVSAMDFKTKDLCIISGSLKSMNEDTVIEFSDLRDENNQASTSDELVTSNISDIYLEGIPIGYVVDIDYDSNNLTKSGSVALIADFEHMDNVFVLLATKDSIVSEEGEGE